MSSRKDREQSRSGRTPNDGWTAKQRYSYGWTEPREMRERIEKLRLEQRYVVTTDAYARYHRAIKNLESQMAKESVRELKSPSMMIPRILGVICGLVIVMFFVTLYILLSPSTPEVNSEVQRSESENPFR